MTNEMIINIFNSDNRNITNIKKQNPQMMAFIVYIIESMIKKPIVTNHVFITFITFSRSIPSLLSVLL